MRADVENVSNGSAVEALWALGALEPKNGLSGQTRGLGGGGKGAENSPPKAPFSATLSQVQRL